VEVTISRLPDLNQTSMLDSLPSYSVIRNDQEYLEIIYDKYKEQKLGSGESISNDPKQTGVH